MFTFTNPSIKKYTNYVLYLLTILEKKTNIKWFRNVKIYIMKYLFTLKCYGNNEITNIICTKPDKNGKCIKAIEKIKKYTTEIFEIYPRGLVYCVYNKNNIMLKCLEEMGYPIEMIAYANNYNLLKQKQKRYHFQL